ncbi:ammonia-dependent NAD(+) synthetase [Vibrio crassostreae]|uniref:ammonia-dependent NAD(+) synthetase n=1 Tax=Vibrio crassostreae TaxID=246167 RepID=UPI001B30B6F0|nr:ammonia-dependent NAD(+) synthetase [Vibrio crassostreae]
MDIKTEILNELGVKTVENFNPKAEVEKRVNFLVKYLQTSGRKGFVLGISGGVDSTTAGRLVQLAVEKVRAGGGDATFTAVRLPYGIQMDEEDAQEAVNFIAPDCVETINIKPSVDAAMEAYGELQNFSTKDVDFAKGNAKARLRMTEQYLIAGLKMALVVGTDHSAEAVTGFYTLHGDGAADILPLAKLNKRQVRAIAKELGAPSRLHTKQATADLEDLNEHLLDEDALGVSYNAIDNYLEGKEVGANDAKVIEDRFNATRFKRKMPTAYGEL